MSKKSVAWAFNFAKWNPTHFDVLSATSCVQNEEKTRLAKFVFKSDFKSSLVGRLMMRKFVSESTGWKYDEIRFVRDEKGRPLLAPNSPSNEINFNVSHQGDYTVLAGVKRGDLLLGVDVMKIEWGRGRNLGDYFRVMTRTLSGSEWECIKNNGDDRAQLAMFYRHWCLKESYLKAVGVGITVNLQDVRFKINTRFLRKGSIVDDTQVYFKGELLTDWFFHETMLDDDHCVAVAINGKVEDRFEFEEISFDYLMSNAEPLLEQDEEYCRNFFDKLEKV